MVKPPGPAWIQLSKEAQDAITQRANESAQALATWEAAQAQEAADDQIEAERSASSTRGGGVGRVWTTPCDCGMLLSPLRLRKMFIL